jgi:predicted dehydrogenase
MADIDARLNYQSALPVDKSVGIGCVGSGFIMADCQLVAYRSVGFNPIAIASRKLEHAKAVAERHDIPKVYADAGSLLADPEIEVLDIAVPPDVQFQVIRTAVRQRESGCSQLRGILAQKPLGIDYRQAQRIVQMCQGAGITLAVNQNMRWDQSIRACKDLLGRGLLGDPVLATIDMRAIPHWQPWQQRLGWLTLRIMSIHHLDAFRYWFGDPVRVYASTRTDPRTQFEHTDGICLTILEYDSGLRALACDDVWTGPAREGAQPDLGIRWRVEGLQGLARGTIGWPDYPKPTPSTIDFTTVMSGQWHKPRWRKVWFPDAFVGPMAELLMALEENRQPTISGSDHLQTMALVEACYQSARTHRAVTIESITGQGTASRGADDGMME